MMIEDNYVEELRELANLADKIQDEKLRDEIQHKIWVVFGPMLYAKYYIALKEDEIDADDFKEAIKPAAEDFQSIDAMMFLGHDAYNHRDYENAKKYFELAAEIGYPVANNNLAALYMEGEGVEKDYAKAHEYALKAAEKGVGSAMDILANLYEHGRGVKKDLKKALHWYEEGSKAGFVNSTYSTAMFIHNTSKGKEDDVKCAMLLQEAAARGFKPAILKLAYFYMEGIGVQKDLEYARLWLNRADENDEEVKKLDKKLKQLEKRRRTGSGKMA